MLHDCPQKCFIYLHICELIIAQSLTLDIWIKSILRGRTIKQPWSAIFSIWCQKKDKWPMKAMNNTFAKWTMIGRKALYIFFSLTLLFKIKKLKKKITWETNSGYFEATDFWYLKIADLCNELALKSNVY